MIKYWVCLLTCLSTSLSAHDKTVRIAAGEHAFRDMNNHLILGPLSEVEQRMLAVEEVGSELVDDILWGKVSFFNATGRDQELTLRVSRDLGAERIVVYTVSGGEMQEIRETSGFLSSFPKDVEFQHDLFTTIFLPRDKEVWIYLENHPINGYDPFFDLALFTSKEWQSHVGRELVFQSMVHGVLWVLLLFSLMLFFQTRDRTLLYYSLYLFAFSGFSAIINNQVTVVLDLPNRTFFFLLFNQSFFVFYLLFLQDFISLPTISPRWNVAMKNVVIGLTVVGLVGLIYSLFYPRDLLLIEVISRITICFSMLVIVSIAFLCIAKSSYVLRYVGLGTVVLIIGMSISLVHALLLNEQTAVYSQIGILLEALIFSVGLGYKMKVAGVQQRETKDQLISQLEKNQELQRTMSLELEKMVALSIEEILSQKCEIEEKAALLEEKNLSLSRISSFKDHLFAIIGHDLRSPIKSLKGILELHTKNQLNGRELELFISKIHKSLNRVIALLDNLLMWALQQMDRIDNQPQIVSMQALVQENIDLLAPLANEKKIELMNHVTGDLQAFADEEMIKLVLRNLISNAIKFSNTGKEVQINGGKSRDSVLIHVSDGGIGISNDNMAKLFDDVVYTTYGTAKEKGTGLGLSLCSEFIKKNNGSIYVESELGKGSTFTIELPTK